MDTLQHDTTTYTDVGHHLLRAALAAALTRRHVGHARPLYVGSTELPLSTVFGASHLDTRGVWLWVLASPTTEFACLTETGQALLAQWDRALFTDETVVEP